MTQKSGSATAGGIRDDLKLCGCSQHSQYHFPETEVDDSRPRNPPDSSGSISVIEFPRLAIEPTEHVLVYGSEDLVTLKDVGVAGKTPYFASDGYLTDFSGRRLPGSQILAALPVDLSTFGETLKWPPPQREPFDQLPVDATNVVVGFARNSFKFGDGNSIVTVGAALPRLLLLRGGAAMFWVTSCQAITQGTGRYEGARGIQSFSGSSYFPTWPTSPEGQVGLLSRPFRAKIHRCIKVALKGSQAA
jgi:hypothetical protein